jgi:hypothetical protein
LPARLTLRACTAHAGPDMGRITLWQQQVGRQALGWARQHAATNPAAPVAQLPGAALRLGPTATQQALAPPQPCTSRNGHTSRHAHASSIASTHATAHSTQPLHAATPFIVQTTTPPSQQHSTPPQHPRPIYPFHSLILNPTPPSSSQSSCAAGSPRSQSPQTQSRRSPAWRG